MKRAVLSTSPYNPNVCHQFYARKNGFKRKKNKHDQRNEKKTTRTKETRMMIPRHLNFTNGKKNPALGSEKESTSISLVAARWDKRSIENRG